MVLIAIEFPTPKRHIAITIFSFLSERTFWSLVELLLSGSEMHTFFVRECAPVLGRHGGLPFDHERALLSRTSLSADSFIGHGF